MITFALLQVGVSANCTTWILSTGVPIQKHREYFSILQLPVESWTLEKISSGGTICNHIQLMTFVLRALLFCLGIWALACLERWGFFCLPAGICCVLRYKPRVCQNLCWIKAAVTLTQSRKRIYRLSHLALRLFRLHLQNAERCDIFVIYLITPFPLCATLLSIHSRSLSFTWSCSMDVESEIREL